MTPQELSAFIAESRAICDRATPGTPIVSRNALTGERTLDALYSGGIGRVIHRYDKFSRDEDVQFDKHARTALPAALAELEALSKMREAAEAWRKHIAEIVGERGDELDISLRSHRERVVALLDATLVGRGPGK